MQARAHAITAMVLYATGNVVMELKLSQYGAAALQLYWYSIMLPLTVLYLGYRKYFKQPISAPSGNDMLIAACFGFIMWFADFKYLSAYTSRGSLLMITTVLTAMPALASIMKAPFTHQLPNLPQFGGYLLVALGVVLVIAYER